jgi:hypothetical protein
MRKLIVLLSVLSLPCVSTAQNNSDAWTNLSSLSPGKKIQILDTSSRKHSGDFINATDASIAFTESSHQQSLQKSDIRTVKVNSNKRRTLNALLIGAAGAGIGAGIGAAVHKGCPSSQTFCLDIGGRGLAAGIGAAIGGVGGITIGALLPAHTTIYNAPVH